VELGLKREECTKVKHNTALNMPRAPVARCLEPRLGFRDFVPLRWDPIDPETSVVALEQRCLRKCPNAHDSFFEPFLYETLKWAHDQLPDNVEPWDFEKYLDSTSYTLNYKQKLRDRYESMGEVSVYSLLSYISIIKREPYFKMKPPRVIQTCPIDSKILFGPMVKSFEEVVYSLGFVLKHKSPQQKARLISEMGVYGTYVMVADHKAFEASITPKMMSVSEVPCYLRMSQSDLCYKMCAVLMGRHRIKMRRGIKTILECRMSGDMVTSLGNSLDNYLLIRYMLLSLGVEDGKYMIYVEGDDSIIVSSVKLNSEMFLQAGFTTTIEDYSDVSHASFCGLVYDECTMNIIRDPIKFLLKFGWTDKQVYCGEERAKSLLRGKAYSVLYETPQCPIVSVAARVALQITEGSIPYYVRDEYHDVVPSDFEPGPYEPPDSLRILFEEVYGINIQTQILVECMIASFRLNDCAQILGISDLFVLLADQTVMVNDLRQPMLL